MLKLYESGRMRNGRKPEKSEEKSGGEDERMQFRESKASGPRNETVVKESNVYGATGVFARESSLPASSLDTPSKRHPGEIRLQKELEELDLPACCRIEFECNESKEASEDNSISSWISGSWMGYDWTNNSDSDQKNNETELSKNAKNSLLSCKVHILPDEGFWEEAALIFQMNVPIDYPHVAPKVRCITKIYHPNIDFEGNICLNILREDWKPVLSLSSVIYGILHLLLEPNPTDPLNQSAATTLRENPDLFARKVSQSLRGGTVDGERFKKLV